MSNTYGISKQDEQEIRARDKTCVYCGILMKQSPHAMAASGATIEHFNNDGPFKKKYNRGHLLSTLQFQQKNYAPVRLVQDALLSRAENKRRNGFKTSQGIYAIGKAVLIVRLLQGSVV